MFILYLLTQVAAQCSHPIFCQGSLLHAVQTLKIYTDGKTFVDMWMKDDQEVILQEWKKIDSTNKEAVTAFLVQYLSDPGQESVQIHPSDYQENPTYTEKIAVAELKSWSLEINQIWLELCKQFKEGAEKNSSIIPVPNPFFVPGGRFREFYYWDTLWVIDGLLVSKMFDSAIKMQQNFIYLLDTIGYIPNGARIYYKGRTQPPIVTQITNNIYEALKKDGQEERANNLVSGSYSALEKEFQYFYEQRSIRACLLFQNTYCDVMLYHYDSLIYYPRPESYNEDYTIGKANTTIYHEITAGAESGWDFSTRWFQDQTNLETIQTSHIIPVDLNTFMILNMKVLASFSTLLGKNSKATFYNTLYENSQTVVLEKLYNTNTHQWNDYNYKDKKFNTNFYASNYFPLLLTNKAENQVITDIQKLINEFPGGIPTSSLNSGQQWDYPNSWPPLNQVIIQGLLNNGQQAAALGLAQNVINNAYCSYQNAITVYQKGYMFEKYDATTVGKQGGGGEYEVQAGFGWTNGVVIWILDHFGQELKMPECPQNIVS